MNDAQIFQLIGIVYCSVGIGAIMNKNFYDDLFEGFRKNLSLTFINGVLAVIAGYLLVSFHNVWAWELSVIITIFGWLALLKGIFFLIMPKVMLDKSKSMLENEKFLAVHRILMMIFGVGFLYIGYFVL